MRSGHSTWRPLFRTIERSWPLKTLPHRFSPPPLDIQWVGQVRNEPHCNSVLFLILSTPPLSVSPSHSCFITFGYFPPMPSSLFPHHLFPPRFSLSSSFKTHLSKPFSSPTPPLSLHSKPTLTDEYQTTGPGSSSNTFPLPPAPLTLLCTSPLFLFFFQTASFHAITFLWI